MYPAARIHHSVLLLLPIDPVLGQVLAKNRGDNFRSLFSFDAGHKVQLCVDVGVKIKRASVA
jgi:hypothetical protein